MGLLNSLGEEGRGGRGREGGRKGGGEEGREGSTLAVGVLVFAALCTKEEG